MKEYKMNQLILSDEESNEIKSIVVDLVGRFDSAEEREFLNNSAVYARKLPERVHQFLNDFKQLERSTGVCLISGYPLNNFDIGDTPPHWRRKAVISATLEEEMVLVLFGALLGELIGWSTQQEGHLVHDVIPIQENEDSQLGTGSKTLLWWHTEDAFHPLRGDYLVLMCLRNPGHVPTTFACVDKTHLTEKHLNILFQSRFYIRPDESHSETNRNVQHRVSEPDDLLDTSYARLAQIVRVPEALPVLFGDRGLPYVRIDPYFMTTIVGDRDAEEALEALVKGIEEHIVEEVLQPGSFLFIDNYRTVHGRKAFTAQYDGTDRWLKRINITRDLRRSRAARTFISSRVIF
jgi:Fe(II)/alpha-ketoglutarate-dependent arginine beta-hydroxylase